MQRRTIRPRNQSRTGYRERVTVSAKVSRVTVTRLGGHDLGSGGNEERQSHDDANADHDRGKGEADSERTHRGGGGDVPQQLGPERPRDSCRSGSCGFGGGGCRRNGGHEREPERCRRGRGRCCRGAPPGAGIFEGPATGWKQADSNGLLLLCRISHLRQFRKPVPGTQVVGSAIKVLCGATLGSAAEVKPFAGCR